MVKDINEVNNIYERVHGEIKHSRMSGVCASQGQPWDLTIVYENGYKLRINVFLTSSSPVSLHWKLYDISGHRRDQQALQTDIG